MHRFTSPLLLLATLGFTASLFADTSFKIDPVHSTVAFGVKHMAVSKVKGKFDEFSGAIVLDEHNAIKEASGTIQTKSINTGVAGRDKDLRAPGFFDVEKYPTITFQTKRIEKQGDQVVLIGDYSMHGVTKTLALPATLSGPVKDAFGGVRIGLEAKTKLNRQDYGMSYNRMLEVGGLVIANEVEIEINAEAVKMP